VALLNKETSLLSALYRDVIYRAPIKLAARRDMKYFHSPEMDH